MIKWVRNCVFLLFLCFSFAGFSQESNQRTLTIALTSDTIQLDSLTIYPNSFNVTCGSVQLSRNEYELDYARGKLLLFSQCSDSVVIRYRVIPIRLSKIYGDKDSSLIYNKFKGDRDKYLITTSDTQQDIFGGSAITKTGSISRGIAFGNNQNLAVNSSLNLELSGDITPNLKLLASVSDNNLPIQADGNTNKLQEFDQLFIQLYNDKFKLIAGDFWLNKPQGYFMTYRKRAQGLTVEHSWGVDTNHVWKTQVSGALSKGKFARQIIPGIEGNQGPYRLKGNDNEPFIIVLAGTENVYIDGRLLNRGQEYDYVVNYNSSEVIFTSRNQITKDSRIVIEFQYSDQNYARSLFQSATTYHSKKMDFWINGYTEQDVKNQPLQQNLTDPQKLLLSEVGDSLKLARSSSVDSTAFVDNLIMYKIVDSLGYDSILVYSVNKDVAHYKAIFESVGEGKGNYVFNSFNALGKVYKWVAPVNGVSQGSFEPSRLLAAPKQKQMLTSGISYQLRKGLKIETELVYSKNDINTFSLKDRKDDESMAIRSKLTGLISLGKDSIPKWSLESKLEIETLDKNFSPIEQYRAVEFDRDWNTSNKGYLGNQFATTGGLNFKRKAKGNINIEGQQFTIGTDYQGLRTKSNGKWNDHGVQAIWEASYLESRSITKNQFTRHKVEISKSIKSFRIGYKDDHELNTFNALMMNLDTKSYRFFDYQFYISNGDSVKNNYKLFYRERFDQKSDSSRLIPVAKAKTIGGEITIISLKNQTLNIVTSYRELKIINTNLLNQTPENTLLGRIDYELRALKGAITWNNFYEIGSGLELKKEFLYIKVNDGQGVYTWIDYNADGVKDLNEFEVAQYVDQASYIRVFTPSNTYVKTYSNELNEGLFLKPERMWANKKGFRKFVARFSDQARIRLNRKTNLFNGSQAFNPFSTAIRDTNLLSTASNIRNTLFFNRTSSSIGIELTYQDTRSKTLLASGFDSRQNTYNEVSLRCNIKKVFTIEVIGQKGIKITEADYTTGRNYYLNYYFVKPSLIFQPTTTFRATLNGRYSTKKNAPQFGADQAIVKELGSSFKYNQTEKGSLNGTLTAVNIRYTGVQNSALGFEMLEALRPGLNFTWNLGYQHSVSKTLQISLQYNGRKSENSRMIHSGGMEVRAFF